MYVLSLLIIYLKIEKTYSLDKFLKCLDTEGTKLKIIYKIISNKIPFK